ncbi:MAG: hypothetical protein AAFV43_05450 [Planctomycetota bacterium]
MPVRAQLRRRGLVLQEALLARQALRSLRQELRLLLRAQLLC